MWPFDKLLWDKKFESCAHEWKQYERTITHGKKLYFEDGQPVIHRMVVNGRQCEYCGKIEQLDSKDEYLYLSVERVEECH